jgi:DNA-binding NarL/FixJ family response regulator
LPHEEIARRLNVARSTVSVTVNRMRARLGTTDHSMAGCAKFFAALTKALKS